MNNQIRGIFWTVLLVGISTTSSLRPDAYDFWLKRESGTTRHLFASAASEDVIIAVGEQGTILTSMDGLAWRTQSLTTNAFYGANLWTQKTNFLAVGQGGQFASSDDGVQWRAGDFGVDVSFHGIASSGTIATVGPQMILLSANGLTWAPEVTGGLLYGAGIVPAQRLAVVGANGVIWAKAGLDAWRDNRFTSNR
jgi:hypothetical protein